MKYSAAVARTARYFNFVLKVSRVRYAYMIPDGTLVDNILEKLEFEKPHIPRHMEDSIEILNS